MVISSDGSPRSSRIEIDKRRDMVANMIAEEKTPPQIKRELEKIYGSITKETVQNDINIVRERWANGFGATRENGKDIYVKELTKAQQRAWKDNDIRLFFDISKEKARLFGAREDNDGSQAGVEHAAGIVRSVLAAVIEIVGDIEKIALIRNRVNEIMKEGEKIDDDELETKYEQIMEGRNSGVS